ncbi:MAG: hypothetical protein L0Y35_08720, partial [Flammeovirgaceae bacterium]|nr:hypothetical protein [Flammeovirgaceae bacterium]
MMKGIPIFFNLLMLVFHNLNGQQPVITTRPRILLNTTIKSQLIARKNANDPSWLAIKSDADQYATWPVITPYTNP